MKTMRVKKVNNCPKGAQPVSSRVEIPCPIPFFFFHNGLHIIAFLIWAVIIRIHTF